MARISRPHVPEGPLLAFFDRLHDLHVAAGQPSMRQLQRQTRSTTRPAGIDPTTIHATFTRPKPARWEVVASIVRVLGGDLDEFAPLWQAARIAERDRAAAGPPPAPDRDPAVDRSPRLDRDPAVDRSPRLDRDPAVDRSPRPDRDPAPTGDPNRTAPVGNSGSDPAPARPDLDEGRDRVRSPAPAAVPRELPPDVSAFTGRAAALDDLAGLLADRDGRPTAPVICVVTGTAGVGKTALAIHWAHRVADRFPDGQLYADLRGYDLDQPVSSAEVLAGFLRTLGVAGRDIPYDLAERSARFRSSLAGRRMLVVLDNANSVEHVRPLLAGTPSCLVLVTSRDRMAGLIARHGAHRIDLDLFSRHESACLLRTLIGERAAAETAAVEAMARLCAGLPLALRVAAEVAIDRPDAALSEVVAEFGDERRRLDLLDAGADDRTGVRAVFSWSYRHLPPITGRLFRLLGIKPGPAVDVDAAHALLGGEPAETAKAGETGETGEARAALDHLARAHLVRRDRDGRYIMHDLLRAYAGRLADDTDSAADRRAALTRLFDHYLTAAQRAMDAVFPAERHSRPGTGAIVAASTGAVVAASTGTVTATPVPVDSPVTARRWLDRERATLVDCAVYAASRGWPAHAVNLAGTLWRYLHNGAYHSEAAVTHNAAVDAARRLADRAAEATALANLGTVYWRWSRYDEAADRYGRALAIFEALGDRRGQARVLSNLGAVQWQRSDYARAARSCQRAVALYLTTDDRAGEARALDNLGAVYARQGHLDLAAETHQRALAILSDLGDRAGEGRALDNLGVVFARQGHHDLAEVTHRRALTTLRDIGDRSGEAQALENLGALYHQQGRDDLAAEVYHRALEIATEIGRTSREVSVRNALGDAARTAGRSDDAHTWYASAFDVAAAIGDRYEQARALDGLAHVWHSSSDPHRAGAHWREALAIYEEIGVPEAGEVRRSLTTVGLSMAAPEALLPDAAPRPGR